MGNFSNDNLRCARNVESWESSLRAARWLLMADKLHQDTAVSNYNEIISSGVSFWFHFDLALSPRRSPFDCSPHPVISLAFKREAIRTYLTAAIIKLSQGERANKKGPIIVLNIWKTLGIVFVYPNLGISSCLAPAAIYNGIYIRESRILSFTLSTLRVECTRNLDKDHKSFHLELPRP